MRPQIPNDLSELRRALAEWDTAYDPAERMIRRPFHSPGYHTVYRGDFTHPTRESLDYALALLDSGEEERLRTACGILDRVLALQDTDPESKTYGIWSWFMEEPLERMSPPDWNWADFCGTALIQVAMDHRARLPGGLAERLDASLHHAVRSIMRRDMGPHYTNIALMGTHVTYTVGELYGDAEVLEYARRRLRRFAEHTREQGAFNEYNSPTYTSLAIRILARMLRDIDDPGPRPILEELHDLVWSDVARHFHPPTRQWAGPHSRCYSTLLGTDALGFLQRAVGPAADLTSGQPAPNLEANRLQCRCPEAYVPLFVRLNEAREFCQVYGLGAPLVVGHTHLDETVAVGSVNRGSFWNQQRALVAYWGNAQAPIALQVRFLHDGYDYCSALLFSCQAGPYVLAAVLFATDGGDTHPGLDRVRDATIEAEDLRLRFHVLGAPPGTGLPPAFEVGRPLSFPVGNAVVHLDVAYAAFGGRAADTEVSRAEGLCLDVRVHTGTREAIDFRSLGRAAIVFGLSVSAGSHGCRPVEVTRDDGQLVASWGTPHGPLCLSVPERPAAAATITAAARGVEGARVE